MLHEALDRMPHKGPMRLIAVIEAADETSIRCLAGDHAVPDYPLRLDGVLYAAVTVELGAQAAAAHASLFGIGMAHTGLVLSIGGLALHALTVEGPAQLRMTADRLQILGAAAAYRFAVEQNGRRLVDGELLLSMKAAR